MVRLGGECIRKLQQGRRPTRPSAVRKEDGQLTQDPKKYCKGGISISASCTKSTFSDEVIQQMSMLPPCLDLDGPPTEELEAALSKMKLCKAGGKTGIMPELVLFGGGSSGTGC